jgi:hypothetical protein
LQALAHLDEQLPDLLFWECPAHLALQQLSDVTSIAKFHDNVDFAILDKRLIVPDDVFTIEPRHNARFICCLLFLSIVHARSVNLLKDINVFVIFTADLEHNTKAALA